MIPGPVGGNAWTCKAQGLLGARSNFFTRRGETMPETWLSATPSALLRLPKPARIVERPRHKKNRNASGCIKSLNPHGIVKQSLGIPSILFATLSLGNSLSQHILVVTAPLKNDDLSREIPTAPRDLTCIQACFAAPDMRSALFDNYIIMSLRTVSCTQLI